MTTIELPLATIDLSGPVPTMGRETPMVVTPPGEQPTYRVVIVDMEGNSYGVLSTAIMATVTWKLYPWDEFEFSVSLDDPFLDEVPLANDSTTPHREIQVWRNGALLIWGVPVQRKADSESRRYTYTCYGLIWYLARRHVGKADRHNFLTNPRAETGSISPWSVVGSNVTATAPTERPLAGSRSFKIVGTGAGDQNRYLKQSVVMEAGPLGLAVFLAAWVYIETLSFGGLAYKSRGLRIKRAAGLTGGWAYGDAKIDGSTPQDQWVRLTCYCTIPPNTTTTIEARLYALVGTAFWDEVQMVVQESVSFYGIDQAIIARELMRHAQGVGPAAMSFGVHNGKTDLHFGNDCPSTGIEYDRHYQHAAHAPIYTGGRGNGALDEFTKADNGFDVWVRTTPTTRQFRTEYPQRGVDRTDLQLRWVVNPEEPGESTSYGIVGWDDGGSIVNSANSITELSGWGGSNADLGATREEGSYVNLDKLGGVSFELVESAPSDTGIDQLDRVARARGGQLAQQQRTPRIFLEEPRHPETGEVLVQYIGVLKPGDTIAPYVIDGGFRMTVERRISELRLDCSNDRLAATPVVQA